MNNPNVLNADPDLYAKLISCGEARFVRDTQRRKVADRQIKTSAPVAGYGLT